MKNMKLGMKMALAFGILIGISLVLGGMAVWNMTRVQGSASTLATELLPEVDVANNVERMSLFTMYAMRGYALSEENAYLDESRKHLEEVKRYLKDAKDLATRTSDAELKDEVDKSTAKVNEYEQLAKVTAEKNDDTANIRKQLDGSARKFMDNCSDFAGSQNELMKKEIASDTDADKLLTRFRKVVGINEIVDLGNETRLAVWKAQVERSPKAIQEAEKNFDGIGKKLEELRALTTQDANLKQLDNIKEAAAVYRREMGALADNYTALSQIHKKRGDAANEVLENA